MESDLYDVIVIGAGVEGSATAYNLAKSNHKTLLLEQFALPHTRGSSHGQSRITRKSYEEDYYAKMMVTAFSMWEELEREEGVELYVPTGVLSVEKSPAPTVKATIRALESISATHEYLDADNLAKRFPMLRFDSTYQAVYSTEGGVLRADRALRSFWNQYKKNGGIIHDDEKVTDITPGNHGNPVIITTNKQTYQAKSVVICAGPWTSKLVTPLGLHLPLKPVRVGVYYWKAKTDQYRPGGMPAFIIYHRLKEYDTDVWGMPAIEYPDHAKICCHTGPEIDPDDRDSDKHMPEYHKITVALKAAIADNFPGLVPDPAIQETCIYTTTPDENFILDTHPHWKNIVIGAGFSGTGFKMAPVVGKVLSELATGKRPSFTLEPFAIDRFFKSEKAKL